MASNIKQFYFDEAQKKRIQKFNIVRGKEGELFYTQTKEWKAYKLDKRNEILLKKSNLPSHVKGLSLDDYIGEDKEKIEKLKLYLEKFDSKFNEIHLFFWSHENGTQKTTTSGIVAKELLLTGHSVNFILMGKLIKDLSEEKFDKTLTPMIDLYRNCDFLVIDDSFDKKKATIYKSGFQIPFLDEFLRQRLEIERKATCFSSNFSIDEIDEEIFGKSMKNLIRRSIKDPFKFNSSFELRNDFNPKDLWS